MTSEIYTIGHSNQSLQEFVQLARRHGVSMIVDVRSSPYSKYVPHFSKDSLQELLPQMGLKYHYLGKQLGGKPRNPVLSPAGKVDYSLVQQQPWFKQGIDELQQLATEYRLAIMCAEENPTGCHREKLVGAALRRTGVHVTHIRKTGLDKGNTTLNEFF